jgi:hypothetical protein
MVSTSQAQIDMTHDRYGGQLEITSDHEYLDARSPNHINSGRNVRSGRITDAHQSNQSECIFLFRTSCLCLPNRSGDVDFERVKRFASSNDP